MNTKILSLTFIFLINFLKIFCQPNEIHFFGKLIDSISSVPVPYALLYIDGTTIGTTSDTNGNFNLVIPNIPIHVEISHLSYQAKSIKITDTSKNPIIIELLSKEIHLKEIVILGRRLKQEYIEKFTQGFLGTDYWGKNANLLNENSLIFDVSGDRFLVTSTEPLMITLPKLGYDVHIDLEEFIIENNDHFNMMTTRYKAKFHFKPREENNRYSKNRLDAYYNSSQHFLRSLYTNKLNENGYKVFDGLMDSLTHRMTYVPHNLDKSISKIKDNCRIINLKSKEFYVFYYEGKNSLPLDLNINKPRNYFKMSTIYFETDSIPIFYEGTTSSNSILFTGTIGEKRAGAMLPADFEVQEPVK